MERYCPSCGAGLRLAELTASEKHAARLIRDGYHPRELPKLMHCSYRVTSYLLRQVYLKLEVGGASFVRLAVMLSAPLDSPFREAPMFIAKDGMNRGRP